MSIEQTLGLRPWRWGLRTRLAWAALRCHADTKRLSEVAGLILESHLVQSGDLAGAVKAADRFQVLSMAADATREIRGVALEFGVFEGVTMRCIARSVGPERNVVGFDTFEGLPDDWGSLLPKGTFDTNVPSFDDHPNVSLRVGRIEETLPTFLEDFDQWVSLLHIDVPYYESTLR